MADGSVLCAAVSVVMYTKSTIIVENFKVMQKNIRKKLYFNKI